MLSRDGLVECFGLGGDLGFGDRFGRDDLGLELAATGGAASC